MTLSAYRAEQKNRLCPRNAIWNGAARLQPPPFLATARKIKTTALRLSVIHCKKFLPQIYKSAVLQKVLKLLCHTYLAMLEWTTLDKKGGIKCSSKLDIKSIVKNLFTF